MSLRCRKACSVDIPPMLRGLGNGNLVPETFSHRRFFFIAYIQKVSG